jgi:hypothetical protein
VVGAVLAAGLAVVLAHAHPPAVPEPDTAEGEDAQRAP